MLTPAIPKRPLALVLSGGGARGAYEAGVLSYLFEEILPIWKGKVELDIASGTSVGAIHAAYTLATRGTDSKSRASILIEAWESMRASQILRLRFKDLLGLPLRALGLRSSNEKLTLGGLVDLSKLDKLIADRIPWTQLEKVLKNEHLGLCVSCTEIRSGRVVVFMSGGLANPNVWLDDPNARAEHCTISTEHVRASAAIPFLFPAVRIGKRYYVDGGLRMNTPLSPALRLGAQRALVVCLRHPPPTHTNAPPYPEAVIKSPSFDLGKILNELTLDQLEYELKRLDLINEMISQGELHYGSDFLDKINIAVKQKRGRGYSQVETQILRPSEDLGKIAGESIQGAGKEMGTLTNLLAKLAAHNPGKEADLLSYLLFDRVYTKRLIELGRSDAKLRHDEIRELLEP